MALTTSTITGRVPLPNGAGAKAARLTFTLSDWDTEDDEIVLPDSVTVALEGDGSIPDGFELWRNTEGLRGTSYRVEVSWRDEGTCRNTPQCVALGSVTIGDEESYSLADLLAGV